MRFQSACRLALTCLATTGAAPLVMANEVADLDCSPAHGVTPLCGFERPEDIEVVAAGTRLLVSEYRGLNGESGGPLVLFDPEHGTQRVVYPHDAQAMTPGSSDRGWGSDDCPGRPGGEFAPHGIHYSTLDGRERVLVVNHGGREAVELFEVIDGQDGQRFALAWRGCVPAPEGIWMNDVVGLRDGGLAVSHMVTRALSEDALYEAEARHSQTGWVMRWQPDQGWTKIAGSDGALPNGLEVAADGAILYINEYFGDQVVALDLVSGRQLWRAAVAAPDNASRTDDGVLLITSHRVGLKQVLACNAHPLSVCAIPYAIVALRERDGAAMTVFESRADQPMGAATVAVAYGDDIYIGAYVGDRMARIKRPAVFAFDTPTPRAEP